MATKTLKLAHEELIEEEKIAVADLPKEVKNKIQGFKILKGKFDKNPTEKLENSLTIMSVEIADMIQTLVVEKGLKEETPLVTGTPASTPPLPAATTAPIATIPKTPEQIEVEIRAKLQGDLIGEKDVLEILGRKAKDIETFSKTKISKLAWGKPFYRVYFL